jgi:hypothetical protein
MLATAPLINRLGIEGIKLHNLHVIKNTALEKIYKARPFEIFRQDQYVALVADFLEQLNPATVIHRLTGETYRTLTVTPDWSVNKIGVHNAIAQMLAARDTWQGKLWSANAGQLPEQAISLGAQGA